MQNDRAKLAALAALSLGEETGPGPLVVDDSYPAAYSPRSTAQGRPSRSPSPDPSSFGARRARSSSIHRQTRRPVLEPPQYPLPPSPQQYYGAHPSSNYAPRTGSVSPTSPTYYPLHDTRPLLAPQPIAAVVPVNQLSDLGSPHPSRPRLHIPLPAQPFLAPSPGHSPVRAALALGPPSPALSTADTLVGSPERWDEKDRIADPENDRSVPHERPLVSGKKTHVCLHLLV
jgi:hypothetical protein